MKHFVWILLAIFGTSCKENSEPSTTKATFDLNDDPYGILAEHIFRDSFKVCIFEDRIVQNKVEAEGTGSSGQDHLPSKIYTIETLKKELPQAVLAWVQPLRSIADQVPLMSKVEIVEQGCSGNIDENNKISHQSIKITKMDGTVAGTYHHGARNLGHIQLDPYFADYTVLLHEIGHAFGLADTYDSDGCKFGQPNAVMCGRRAKHVQLLPDDINGVKHNFCKFHETRFSSCKQILATTSPGPVPNLDSAGKPLFSLGLQVESFSQVYTEYRVSPGPQNGGAPNQGLALVGPDRNEKQFVSFDANLIEQVKLKNPGKAITIRKSTLLGARISKVDPNGIASKAGAKAGSVIALVTSDDEKFAVVDAQSFERLAASIYDRVDLTLETYESETLASKSLYESAFPKSHLHLKE